MRPGKHHTHPLSALFQGAGWSDREGMRWVLNRGGLVSDCWEYVPAVEEIPPSEQVAIFEAAKVRFNPEFCDRW